MEKEFVWKLISRIEIRTNNTTIQLPWLIMIWPASTRPPSGDS